MHHNRTDQPSPNRSAHLVTMAYNVMLIPDSTGACCFLVLPLSPASIAKLITTPEKNHENINNEE